MSKPDFQNYAKSEFQFLAERYGFTLTASEPGVVKYTTQDVLVEVNYTGRGEVDIIIDTIPLSHRFQFRLFLRTYHPEVEKALGYGIANSDDEVHRELKRLSDALQRYGKPLLEHDRKVFERMKTVKWWELKD